MKTPTTLTGFPHVSTPDFYSKQSKWQEQPDFALATGVVLITVASCFFGFTDLANPGDSGSGAIAGNDFLTFVPIVFIAVCYSIYLLLVGKMKWIWKNQPADGLGHRLLCAVLWLVSCFALNRTFTIFAKSDSWLSGYVISLIPISICFAFRDYLPHKWKFLYLFGLALQLPLWMYFTTCLFPITLLSIPGLLFFGLGIHGFIPLWITVLLIQVLKRDYHSHRTTIIPAICLPVLVTVIGVVQRLATNQKMEQVLSQIPGDDNSRLPQWALVAQKLPNNYVTNQRLLEDLIYETYKGGFFAGRANWAKKHNPVVTITSLFTRKQPLTTEVRKKVLDSRAQTPLSQQNAYAHLSNLPIVGSWLTPEDYRHWSQERFWNGNNLSTSRIENSVQLFPEYRIAYTELLLQIHNSDHDFLPQEALYTFYVPDGTAVTSLSLWVNGKEETGRLTTRQKADSAYKTIVGVEQRDPALVHWQEGNRVSVRVFPCTSKEDRKFKIGFSSPLLFAGNNLEYRNISFSGPPATLAPEKIALLLPAGSAGFRTTLTALEKKQGNYGRESDYQPFWTISITAPALSKTGFLFEGKSYTVSNYTPAYEKFHATDLYIDVNKKWTEDEFDTVYNLGNTSRRWVYDDSLVVLNDQNKTDLFKKLRALDFSLFPVASIPNPAQSLLISKGTEMSPVLSDLTGSNFAEEMESLGKNGTSVRAFVIGERLSPYLKTLGEFRLLHTLQGSADQLQVLLKEQKFVRNIEKENPGELLIREAGMVIAETEKSGSTTAAPDHVLRLFAYNQLLKYIGNRYFSRDYLQSSYFELAEKAHVVSPLSSLIVLETQKDYERFDIKKSKNSLNNASLNKMGAVPEPHEWALIALLLLFFLLVTYKHYVHP